MGKGSFEINDLVGTRNKVWSTQLEVEHLRKFGHPEPVGWPKTVGSASEKAANAGLWHLQLNVSKPNP